MSGLASRFLGIALAALGAAVADGQPKNPGPRPADLVRVRGGVHERVSKVAVAGSPASLCREPAHGSIINVAGESVFIEAIGHTANR